MTRINDDISRPGRRRRSIAVAPIGVVMVSALLLWGCPEELEEGQLEPDQPDSQPVEQVDFDVVGFDDDEGYSRPSYAGQRNPFRPDVDVLGLDEEDDQIDEVRPTEPLERYAIDSLELVTIISQTAVPRAMFVDPTGMGHFAIEGDRIGDAGGVIRDIRSNEVVIEDGDGAATTTVELQERRIETQDDDELTEEERRALERLLGTEEGREALGEQMDETDRRFPGLAPPEQ